MWGGELVHASRGHCKGAGWWFDYAEGLTVQGPPSACTAAAAVHAAWVVCPGDELGRPGWLTETVCG